MSLSRQLRRAAQALTPEMARKLAVREYRRFISGAIEGDAQLSLSQGGGDGFPFCLLYDERLWLAAFALRREVTLRNTRN